MTIRIHIDGNWDAAEFAAFFKSLDDLYNYVSLAQEREFRPEFRRAYAFGPRQCPTDARYRLAVQKLSFASPGFTDIAGIASAMRELRELLQFVITFVSQREDRKISREHGKLEIAAARLDLLERVYRLEQEFGTSMPHDAEKHFGLKSNQLPDLDPLILGALQGRITKLSNPEENEVDN